MGVATRVSQLEEAVLALARLEFGYGGGYDEAEHPRDENGRWTAAGGGSSKGSVDALLEANPPLPGEDTFVYQSRLVQHLAIEDQNEFLFQVREEYAPVPYIVDGIERWCEQNGLPPPPDDLLTQPCSLEEGEIVANYFEDHANDPVTPEVEAAYEDFKEQNERQYEFITAPESEGGLGIKVTFTTENDPYPSAEAQADDLRNNHHIAIQTGLGGAHEATMTVEEYDRFRAVHDVFGHAGVGGGFDRHGEYEAWLMHTAMYTGAGRDAMSTEYHGVNSAVWGGDPGTPGTGGSILLPHEYSIPPWERTVTASAGPAFIKELIERLGVKDDFAGRFEKIAMHPNHSHS